VIPLPGCWIRPETPLQCRALSAGVIARISCEGAWLPDDTKGRIQLTRVGIGHLIDVMNTVAPRSWIPHSPASQNERPTYTSVGATHRD
jgi:hypothetical protein